MRRYRRYSDRDHHLGPYITVFAPDEKSWRPWRAVLSSGDGDEHPGCHLWLAVRGYSFILELPQLFQHWTHPQQSWDRHARKYGFSLNDGFLQVFLGPQTHDSTTTKSWSKFLPWTQWRQVRHSFYGLQGEHIWSAPPEGIFKNWAAFDAGRASVPKARFEFADYDGQRIVATTHIEERETRLGEGWFKWLSLFTRPRVYRRLDLNFSAEVGPEKGSWKGGTTGHGIEMRPGELHEDAFRRYCDETHSAKGARYRIAFGRRLES